MCQSSVEIRPPSTETSREIHVNSRTRRITKRNVSRCLRAVGSEGLNMWTDVQTFAAVSLGHRPEELMT